jgi:hypothetical protein
LELEQQEQGYECPFCGAIYTTEQTDCDGTDLVCCGEVGHCTPITQQEPHYAS